MSAREIVRVRVRVTTGAREETLDKTGNLTFGIVVKEKAERGLANKRVRTLLARHFGVPIESVQITAGHHRKNKTLKVV